MAARKNRGVGSLPDDWKEKIKASALVHRLMECAMGQIELSQQQIKSAEILLKKVIPDLNKTDFQPLGADGKPTDPVKEITVKFVNQKNEQ
jgi:hypothetical protein